MKKSDTVGARLLGERRERNSTIHGIGREEKINQEGKAYTKGEGAMWKGGLRKEANRGGSTANKRGW